MTLNRLSEIKYFYKLMELLENKIGGKRLLLNVDGRSGWPDRGVYFFFEPHEKRTGSGIGDRIVRVGTHALKAGSKTTLWNRLRQHKGVEKGRNPGGGNHRGSVFRKHVGNALKIRDNWDKEISDRWGVGSNASREIKNHEYPLENEVSMHIRAMPFLSVEINDAPGPKSMRGYIERNSIALLSNYNREIIDGPSNNWLGLQTHNKAIMESGLWNVNHVNDNYNGDFIKKLEKIIRAQHMANY